MQPNPPPRAQHNPPKMRGVYPVPPAPRRPHPLPPARPFTPRTRGWRLWLVVGGAFLLLCIGICGILTLSVSVMYANGVLPGVSALGLRLEGMNEREAAAALQSAWKQIHVTDGARSFTVDAGTLGLLLDAPATAALAYRQGRGEGNLLKILTSGAQILPVYSIDPALAENGLQALAQQVNSAPVNAGVRLQNGRVQATAPQNGRMLDTAATLARWQDRRVLAGGVLPLALLSVSPDVTDASPMLVQAEHLLNSFFDIRVYDPVTGHSVYWSLPPDQWAAWLTATADPFTPTGLALSADPTQIQRYVSAQSAIFDPSRYIKVDDVVNAVQQAIAQGSTTATARVYHQDRSHVVQRGETIISIAWDYGLPYPYIQSANPGVDALTPGQTVRIPSPDTFLLYPVIPHKRIIVSISQQRVWVYENEQLKWDWVASTGIHSSPTWPGIYQIISHEPNAYAGNWNLWMPHFMGVYKPIPGAEFTNGFHGFPTRGGGQLLWENSLGTKVTYGCILLSNTNIQQLYAWAEEGVVVEIRA